MRCLNCDADKADIHTLLCHGCLKRQPTYWRRQIEAVAIQAALLRQAFIDGEVMGGIRWTEKQYQEHLKKMLLPQKKEPRKRRKSPPPRTDPNALVFELALTPTGNEWQRMHWAARRKIIKSLAEQIEAQIPKASGIPFRRAKVEVIRQTSKEPDRDGLYGSAKGVLDALQVRSKRHPYGTYVIEDDSSDCIDLHVRWEKVPPKHGKTLVIVTPL